MQLNHCYHRSSITMTAYPAPVRTRPASTPDRDGPTQPLIAGYPMKPFTLAIAGHLALGLALPVAALAWGRQGHETIGNIAAALIQGTNAEKQVQNLLKADETLATAAEWPDCAKGFMYCQREPTEEMKEFATNNPHHHAYHYADLPFQLSAYQRASIGASSDDVVSILGDAVLTLQGKPAVDPSHKLTKREALFVIAHMTGDIHQPLHVGAPYVSGSDRFVVPANDKEAKAEFTQGGNLLCHGSKNVHSYWDDDLVAQAMRAAKVKTSADFSQALVPQAQKLKADAGPVDAWPTAWATESLHLASAEIAPLVVTAKRPSGPDRSPCQPSAANAKTEVWDVQLPPNYAAQGAATAADQLTKAGARLAYVLKAIWP